ncbi:uncharacterized protein LOC122244721 [Penaeus japonicus]|uniref:uncharacterized protein LOC122244721 n=1 Tax=Penaeus japonicus TaxID=27405 RepID=UPI001C7128CD|nr:uncharacterized protein LOC122244721 [Penaeus japonicus]
MVFCIFLYVLNSQQDWQFNQLLYEDETSERIPLQQMQQFGINGKSSSSPPCPGSPGTFVMPLSLKNEISQDHTSVSIGSSSSAKANHSWKVLPNTPLQMFYDLQACEGMKRSRRTESPVLPLWIAPEDNWPGNSQVTLRSPSAPLGLSKRSTHDSASNLAIYLYLFNWS